MNPIVKIERKEIYGCNICRYGSICFKSYMNHTKEHVSHCKVILPQATFYKCEKCSGAFLEEKYLKLHRLLHVFEDVRLKNKQCDQMRYKSNGTKYVKNFKCSECNYEFVLESTLQMHMVLHEPFPYVCSCGIGYYKESDLRAHGRLVHKTETKPEIKTEDRKVTLSPKVIYKDDDDVGNTSENCEEVMDEDYKYVKKKRKRKIRKDIKRMVKIKFKSTTDENTIEVDETHSMSCNHCEATCGSFHAMNRHMKEKHADVRHRCIHCCLRFATKEVLKEHKTNCKFIKQLSCRVCDKEFTSKHYFLIHMKTHRENDKSTTCLICDKTYSQPAALYLHLKRHAGVKEFECKHCNKSFYNKTSLELHERVHTGAKPFTCKHCNKGFADPSALNRHTRIHTKEYRYFCDKCPKKYTDASSIIRHRKTHDESARTYYECDTCGRKFLTIVGLREHAKTHNEGERVMYECDYCGKKTTRKGNLFTHIQTCHNQSYECVYCSKNLKTKDLLRRHKRKFHRLILYCSKCPKKFYSQSSFEAHKQAGCLKNSQKG